ncbi:MAG: alpha/beta hydrolase [Alphaproteobacteria bacterium]|nr:alpha/beta hydrolase [Alphaproteobacteria bacterium]
MPAFIGLVFGGYAFLVLLLFVAQRNILYHPSELRPKPADFGVPEMQQVDVPAPDGFNLYSWWRPPQRADKATIVYFHGNAGHIGDRAFKVRAYLDEGYGVMMVSYRYNAGNGGKPSEDGLYEDGRSAYNFVLETGVPRDRIVLYGESLGSGVATKLATENKVAAVVLEAPYSSVTDVAQSHYWYTPARWILLDKFESSDRIATIGAPLLIFHGSADRTIPIRFAEKLFAAAVEPKELKVVLGGGHADLYDFGVARQVLDFLRRHITG